MYFDIKTAKEIIIKPNGDGTFNIISKHYVCDSNNTEIINEIECKYPRAEIKLDIYLLADISNNLIEFIIKDDDKE